jgi:hypothetical protein
MSRVSRDRKNAHSQREKKIRTKPIGDAIGSSTTNAHTRNTKAFSNDASRKEKKM